MRHLINTICIVLLLWGCDHSTAAPAKPIVVRKKIVTPKKQTVNVSTQQKVRQTKTRPVAKRQTKTVTKKVVNNGAAAEKQQVAKKKTESRQPTAKQNNTDMASNKPSGQLIAKKPAISPKSEITVIKPTAKKQEPVGSSSSVADKKSEPAKPMIAATNIPRGGIPALYNPAGKIDPFEPLFREKAVMAKKKKKIKRKPQTPLERIDLSQLKLVGIILAASGNRALVEESSGKGYVVKTGTYIGINGGKIIEIDKELVTVEEQFEDVFGKIQTQKRKLKLPKPPGEF